MSVPTGCPRAMVWASDFDKLPADRIVLRREEYLVVRSPSNPGHYWGNLLLFDDPPAAGDRSRWERLFEAEFADEPRVKHRTFAWDRVDGDVGLAREEFVAGGYEMEDTIGLVATAGRVRPHPRENSIPPRRTAAGESAHGWWSRPRGGRPATTVRGTSSSPPTPATTRWVCTNHSASSGPSTFTACGVSRPPRGRRPDPGSAPSRSPCHRGTW